MRPQLRRRTILVAAGLVVGALAPIAAIAGGALGDAAPTATSDRSAAIVQLAGDPLATSARTRPAQGKKIDFSSQAVRNERARLSALRNDFKQWLRVNAPKAKVTSEYDVALNAVAVRLNGESLAKIASAPLVRAAQYQGLYSKLADDLSVDPDLALIQGEQAWATAPGSAKGQGVKVAVVDSGIDVTHPCFFDTTYPDVPESGAPGLTNNKVVVAKVFYNKPGQTPAAIDSHGTHVAGTVGCNEDTPATVDGVDIPYDMSGVAPRALLGNYNVFPGTVANARSEDILNALDEAAEDGMDVINMSLGGPGNGIQDLLTMAVDNLDRANIVVAMANGNEGPGAGTTGSPGEAPRGISAGAFGVDHYVGAPVTAGSVVTVAAGEFETVAENLTATLEAVAGTGVANLAQACTALPPLTGKIALVARGTCSFTTKIRNAQSAGAVAVLVVNNVAGDPVAMAADGTLPAPTVPAYMVGKDDGVVLATKSGSPTTIGADLTYVRSTNENVMAGFSSEGPTQVDFRVKPDLSAPGVNVLSSVPAAFCDEPPCFAFFQGTSMASPHLAGAAAVVRGKNPSWSSWQVRSALTNTADGGELRNHDNAGLTEENVLKTGSGRLNVLSALGAKVALDPVSVSVGAVPAGSGQIRTATVHIETLQGSGALSTTIGSASGSGVTFSATQPNAAGDVTVTMTAAKGAAPGNKQAQLVVSRGGAPVAHAVLYVLVK